MKTETIPTLPDVTDLAQVPRRDIRYVLICRQNKTEIVKPEHQAIIPALDRFLAENQLSLSEFGSKWDLGIDTIDTMHMRPESWWLWGMTHTTIVERPAESTNIVAGLDRIHAAGFGVKGRKIPFEREDYARILEDAATRRSWV